MAHRKNYEIVGKPSHKQHQHFLGEGIDNAVDRASKSAPSFLDLFIKLFIVFSGKPFFKSPSNIRSFISFKKAPLPRDRDWETQ